MHRHKWLTGCYFFLPLSFLVNCISCKFVALHPQHRCFCSPFTNAMSRVDACNLLGCSCWYLVVMINMLFEKDTGRRLGDRCQATIVQGKSRMVIFLAEVYPSGDGSSSQVQAWVRSMSDSLPKTNHPCSLSLSAVAVVVAALLPSPESAAHGGGERNLKATLSAPNCGAVAQPHVFIINKIMRIALHWWSFLARCSAAVLSPISVLLQCSKQWLHFAVRVLVRSMWYFLSFSFLFLLDLIDVFSGFVEWFFVYRQII